METQDNGLNIKNLQFTTNDSGYFFSKSYTEYNWKFNLDGIPRSITLNHSKILGKRTVFLGRQEICKYQKYTYSFKYSFPIDNHTITITQNGDSYSMKIDDIPFMKLLNKQKIDRFNIIKQSFIEEKELRKLQRKKERAIRKLMTYNQNNNNFKFDSGISDKKNIYQTNINDINDNLNINNENENNINTSSRKENEINIYASNPYFDDSESSENMSNRAKDGEDSDVNKYDDDEIEEEDDEKTVKESFRMPDDSLFNKINNENNEKNDNNENEKEEKLDEDINTDGIKIKEIKSEDEKEESDEDDNINNENEDEDEDKETNIQNENNEKKNNIDLLGEEIYNSSRDKNNFEMNNYNTNLNINNIQQGNQQYYYNGYQSLNPSNPF